MISMDTKAKIYNRGEVRVGIDFATVSGEGEVRSNDYATGRAISDIASSVEHAMEFAVDRYKNRK